MRRQKAAYLSAVAAVVLWSTVASSFKIALRYVDFVQLLLYSSVVSTLTLGAILVARRQFRVVFTWTRREYFTSVGLGLLNPFLYYLVLFKAYERLPAQVAQPLNYTWAIALALLSGPLLHQRIGRREILGGLVSYAGVWVISTRGQVLALRFADPLGIALALGSAFIWAFYWIGNMCEERDPVATLFLNFLFAVPVLVVLCAALSDLRVTSPEGLVAAAYVGVVEMGVTFVLWLTALRLSENTAKVGNLIFVSPFLSLVFIRLALGEVILPSTLAGLVLIVAGLVCQRVKAVGGLRDVTSGGPLGADGAIAGAKRPPPRHARP